MFLFSRVRLGTKATIGSSILAIGIGLGVLSLTPFLFPIHTPDLNSYVSELADYNYHVRLGFLSWSSFKLLGISQEYELRWLAFSSLVIALAIVWYRRNVTFAALYLISQLPVLPMLVGSQIRLCLAVQCFMLMLVFMPRSKFTLILPGLFHASFWLMMLLPMLPILFYFSDYIERYVSYIGGVTAKISAYSGREEPRLTFQGIDLFLCMLIVFVSAFAANRKYPTFIGLILIFLAIFLETVLPWVVVRRLMELYLVIYSPLYFLTVSAGDGNFTRRFYTILHCCSYVALFILNYLNYGSSLNRLNF